MVKPFNKTQFNAQKNVAGALRDIENTHLNKTRILVFLSREIEDDIPYKQHEFETITIDANIEALPDPVVHKLGMSFFHQGETYYMRTDIPLPMPVKYTKNDKKRSPMFYVIERDIVYKYDDQGAKVIDFSLTPQYVVREVLTKEHAHTMHRYYCYRNDQIIEYFSTVVLDDIDRGDVNDRR